MIKWTKVAQNGEIKYKLQNGHKLTEYGKMDENCLNTRNGHKLTKQEGMDIN